MMTLESIDAATYARLEARDGPTVIDIGRLLAGRAYTHRTGRTRVAGPHSARHSLTRLRRAGMVDYRSEGLGPPCWYPTVEPWRGAKALGPLQSLIMGYMTAQDTAWTSHEVAHALAARERSVYHALCGLVERGLIERIPNGPRRVLWVIA